MIVSAARAFEPSQLRGDIVTEPRIPIPIERVQAFCRKYGVSEFALFGSVLRDDFGPDSDVDVMLTFAPGHGFTFENTPDIQSDLEAIFGRRVDAVEKGRIRNPFRRHAILSSYRVIHAA
jgi:predicted nucleotidyltransferase